MSHLQELLSRPIQRRPSRLSPAAFWEGVPRIDLASLNPARTPAPPAIDPEAPGPSAARTAHAWWAAYVAVRWPRTRSLGEPSPRWSTWRGLVSAGEVLRDLGLAPATWIAYAGSVADYARGPQAPMALRILGWKWIERDAHRAREVALGGNVILGPEAEALAAALRDLRLLLLAQNPSTAEEAHAISAPFEARILSLVTAARTEALSIRADLGRRVANHQWVWRAG